MHRSASRRSSLTFAVVLVAAGSLFAGCGDEGAHLPASMSASSTAVSAGSGSDTLDSILGTDPGPANTGLTRSVDDPILAGYDGLDTTTGIDGTDDVWSQANSDWDESTSSIATSLDDDGGWGDDGLIPAGYSSGYGYGDDWGYGYGSGVLGTAALGGFNAFGGAGMMDAGFEDPGLVDDPGLMDASFMDDPSVSAFDPGFADTFDVGGFDGGFDAAPVDAGFDAGFDPGLDAGVADVGFVDAGFDAGVADVGFDAGIGMDTGIVF